jgi:hypothetical protein
MYDTVPTVVPTPVSSAPPTAVSASDSTPERFSRIFARPKSRSFAWPRWVTKMFAGLMSRCTIPFA